jgi:hypothetical protein
LGVGTELKRGTRMPSVAHRHAPRTRREPRDEARAITRDTRGDADVLNSLWESYLRPPGTNAGKDQTGNPAASVAQCLENIQLKVSKPILALAVWNQVPTNATNSASSSPQLNQALVRLLSSVLDLDAATACILRANPSYVALPPYPNRIILDSVYVEERHRHGAEGRLEVCVPVPFGNHESDAYSDSTYRRLARIADQRTWGACTLFWSRTDKDDPRIIVKRPKHKRSIDAYLRLPGDPGFLRVILTIREFHDAPLRTRIRFSIQKHPLIQHCQGQVTVEKEPGRPGAARVINEKLVQFRPEAGDLYQQAGAALKYWLQAETVAFVDKALWSVKCA